MRTRRASLIGLSLAAVVALNGLVTGPAGASMTKTVTTIAPGLSLTKIRLSGGPVRIRVLRIDPTKAVTIDTTLAAPTFGTYTTVSNMATANGALAAVNGDYGMWGPLRPVHSFSDDGSLAATGSLDSAFAVTEAKSHSYISRVTPSVNGAYGASTFTVNAWNTGKPGAGKIDGYTAVGGSVAQPPSSGCFARLLPSAGPQWAPGQVGVARTYVVNAMSCQSSRMALGGGVVLASQASGAGATTIASLVPGSSATLTWSLATWTDVTTSVGGGPMLVDNGRNVAPTGCGYLCELNPRTGVGVTRKGVILLVTVDGRNPGWSIGMTLRQFAAEMMSLGAVQAMNLDGGGSTTMWVKGMGLVNRPTDCLPMICQRDVSNAVLVLPSKEPQPLTVAGAPAFGAPAGVRTASPFILTDPGSTGGYMDALTSGELGPTPRLPASFLRMAMRFRESRSR